MSAIDLDRSQLHATIDITQMTERKIELNFYFVKRNPEMTMVMHESYETLVEKMPILKSIFVVSEEECLEIPKATMKGKRFIFIFDDFTEENEAFKYIFNISEVFIFGPRCLMTMVIENVPTPVGLLHIHNLSMRNLIICPTGMNKQKKTKLKNLVEFMGAFYLDKLTDQVTHLVSDNVRSMKYEIASKNGIKVMHVDWITSVWSKCQNTNANIIATDAQFESFKLPVFFGLCFTTTGLSVTDRNMIKTCVEDNGGRYNLSFNGTVDILIMNSDAIGSQKFKVAQKMGKLCLLPSWITDSVKHGYSLANEPYKLHDPSKQIKASTPTKNDNLTVSKFNPDNTQLSEISSASNQIVPDVSLCESNISLRPSVSASSRQSLYGLRSHESVPSSADYKAVLAKITLAAAKRVGNVLDGLSFHLNGFSIEEMALLGKVLSSLGGTKIDLISDQITHFLVGSFDPKLFSVLDNYRIDPVIVKIDWLAKVIQEKKIVNDSELMIERPGKPKVINEKPSPASKRAMKSLSSTFKKPLIPKFQLEEVKKVDVEQESVLSRYLEKPAPENDPNYTATVNFLMGKYVYIHGFSDSSSGTVILQECERVGASLVDDTFHREIDYIITPSAIMPYIHHNIKRYKHIVSDRWLEECTIAGECIPVQFYHRPLTKLMPNEKPLKEEIFVVSNYKNMEREYIKGLVGILGGDCLEILRKTDNPCLISPNMTGAKCTSAKAWDLAVLPVEWLMECYETKQRVDETNYLLGGTKPTSRNQKRRESIIPSSQDIQNSFEEQDLPIENYGDDERYKAGPSNVTPLRSARENQASIDTPETPYQPMDASFLCKDMSTPRRILTKKILMEGQREKSNPQAVSPRRKRIETILDTPTNRKALDEVESPYPELPDCLKPTEIEYSLRPNSSPASQWHHKRKLEALETNYYGRPKREKRKKVVADPDDSIPHTNNRYDFFKAFDKDLQSPPSQANEASKFLPGQDDDESEDEQKDVPVEDLDVYTEADADFLELQARPAEKPRPKRFVQPDFDDFSQPSAPVYDSENLVVWHNPNDGPPVVRKSSANRSGPNGTRLVPVFGINGLNEEMKKVTVDRIKSLGAEVNDKDFTHLMIPKPSKSEKFLMAIAKGLFVIHFEYAGKCESEATFTDESEYEMGNPKFLKSIAAQYDLDTSTPLFKSAYKWRKWITQDHRFKFRDGAFTEMKFIVAASSVKRAPIINVITAGGGKCVEVEQSDDIDEEMLKREKIKNCLVESATMISTRNAEIIRKLGVKVSNLQSVLSYLMLEKVPQAF